MEIITELSSINEIRSWLDFYGVNYKKSERKAHLVKRMNEVKKTLMEDPNVPGGFEMLSPEDAQKLQEFNQLISLLTEAKLYCSNYLENALLENSMIENKNESVLINHTETVQDNHSDTHKELQKSEIVLDNSILPLIDQETLVDSEIKQDSEINKIKEIEEIQEDDSLGGNSTSIVEEEDENSELVEDEDFEELNENEFDSEKDDFISQIEKSVKNNFKGTVAGIIMVGIPAIGILYWLISSGLL